MWRFKLLLLLILATMTCSVAPAFAQLKVSDATATHDYLEARIALGRATTAGKPADLKAITMLEAQVKAECPDVLAGAPPHVKGEKTNPSQVEISQELLSVTLGTPERVEHPAYARFARIVRRLRWSNSKLTRLLHSLAVEDAEQSAIPSPDLCSDLKFWVASGYTAVSAGTKLYLHRLWVVSSITLIEPEPHESVTNFFDLTALVAHRIEPYEDHADRVLAKKALPPEPRLTAAVLRPLLEVVGGVYVALGMSSTPAA
jgi:hypothetical protein